jgi:hypothetical protein
MVISVPPRRGDGPDRGYTGRAELFQMNSAFVPITSQAMDFATSIDGWFANVNQFHGSDASTV